MNKLKITALKIMLLMLALVLTLIGCSTELTIQEVPAEDNYTYVNPEEVKAESDPNIVIDGVLDEDAYKNDRNLCGRIRRMLIVSCKTLKESKK